MRRCGELSQDYFKIILASTGCNGWLFGPCRALDNSVLLFTAQSIAAIAGRMPYPQLESPKRLRHRTMCWRMAGFDPFERRRNA